MNKFLALFTPASDASKTERIIHWFCTGFIALWFIVAFGTLLGLWPNAEGIGGVAAHVPTFFSVLGFIFLVAAVYAFVSAALDVFPVRLRTKNAASFQALIVFVLLNLSILAFCGFFAYDY